MSKYSFLVDIQQQKNILEEYLKFYTFLKEKKKNDNLNIFIDLSNREQCETWEGWGIWILFNNLLRMDTLKPDGKVLSPRKVNYFPGLCAKLSVRSSFHRIIYVNSFLWYVPGGIESFINTSGCLHDELIRTYLNEYITII